MAYKMIDITKLDKYQIQDIWQSSCEAIYDRIHKHCGKTNSILYCKYHYDLKLIAPIVAIMQTYSATKLIVKNGKMKMTYVMELYRGDILLAILQKTQIKHLFVRNSGIEKFKRFATHGYSDAFDIIIDNLDIYAINFHDSNFLKKNNIFGNFND